MAVLGLDEVFKTLDLLRARAKGAILRKMLAAGGQVLTKAAKAGARNKQVRKSIAHKEKVYAAGRGVSIVGVRTNVPVTTESGRTVPATTIGGWGEFGTEHAAADPFLRPALESARDEVIAAMAAAGEKGLIKELAKS
jgi:HK97 gp10 family phage protein